MPCSVRRRKNGVSRQTDGSKVSFVGREAFRRRKLRQGRRIRRYILAPEVPCVGEDVVVVGYMKGIFEGSDSLK